MFRLLWTVYSSTLCCRGVLFLLTSRCFLHVGHPRAFTVKYSLGSANMFKPVGGEPKPLGPSLIPWVSPWGHLRGLHTSSPLSPWNQQKASASQPSSHLVVFERRVFLAEETWVLWAVLGFRCLTLLTSVCAPCGSLPRGAAWWGPDNCNINVKTISDIFPEALVCPVATTESSGGWRSEVKGGAPFWLVDQHRLARSSHGGESRHSGVWSYKGTNPTQGGGARPYNLI